MGVFVCEVKWGIKRHLVGGQIGVDGRDSLHKRWRQGKLFNLLNHS